MTLHQLINAIELDVKFPRRAGSSGGPEWSVATYEELPMILERHLKPLVDRIAELEGALHHPDDPNHTCRFKTERDGYKKALAKLGVEIK